MSIGQMQNGQIHQTQLSCIAQLELTYESFKLAFKDDKKFTGLGLNVSTTFTGEQADGWVGGWSV